MPYRRIQPGEPMYEFVRTLKEAGEWVCDSSDHNDDARGCSNPECFKHQTRKDEDNEDDAGERV